MKRCILCRSVKHLFSVPKNLNELTKWSNIIGAELLPNDKICICHFRKEDVMGDTVLKIDGNTVIIPSLRKSLIKGSLPVVNCGQLCSSNASRTSINELQVTKTDNLKTYNPRFKSYHSPRNITPIQAPTDITEADNNEHNDLFKSLFSFQCNSMQQWGVHKRKTHIVYTKLSDSHMELNIIKTEKVVIINDECKATIILNEYTWKCINIENLRDLVNLFNEVNYLSVCFGKNNKYSKNCNRIAKSKTNTCVYCQRLKSQQFTYNKNTTVKRLNYKLKNKIHAEKKKILAQKKLQMAQLNDLINTLPDGQKKMVKMCIQASKRSTKGNRYSADWMYSCMLMKMKSPKLYYHMRERKLLPLPCNSTLCRYMKNLDSSSGFQD